MNQDDRCRWSFKTSRECESNTLNTPGKSIIISTEFMPIVSKQHVQVLCLVTVYLYAFLILNLLLSEYIGPQ